MSTVRAIVGISLFLVAMAGLLVANVHLMKMIGAINRKRQTGDRISDVRFTILKVVRIFDEYRSMLPHGRLHLYALTGYGLAAAGMGGLVVLSLWFSE